MNARFAVLLVVVAVGVCVMSPLTAWFAIAIVAVVGLLVRGLDSAERRVVIAIVAVAVALRLVAIAALFLTADHTRMPFATLFADEDYFLKRSLWLRSVSLGMNVHRFDLEYAFEPNGSSSFISLLAAIQTLIGPAPYGLHLLSVAIYVGAVLLLFRVARGSFGRAPALVGLVVLLFLPSLFAWSIAVLKESPFVLLTATALALAATLARTASWTTRVFAVAGISIIAGVVQTLRTDGGSFVVAATVAGLTLGYILERPRLFVAVLVAAPIVTALVLRVPEVQLRAFVALQRAARQHWGAVVVSPGISYKLLDDRFYSDVNAASDLRAGEAARYVMRGAVAFAAFPLPWRAESRAAVAYIPEQVIWYVLAALAAIGLATAFRRDPHVAALFVAYAGLLAIGAALTDGNIGTLVRHRGLTLPYLVWFGGVGACEILTQTETRWL